MILSLLDGNVIMAIMLYFLRFSDWRYLEYSYISRHLTDKLFVLYSDGLEPRVHRHNGGWPSFS